MTTTRQHPEETDRGDVVDLLLAQHGRIEELFRAVRGSSGRAKQEAFEELTHLLSIHETAEEEIVHPAARTSIDAGDEVVQARLAEEHDAKELLAGLMKLDVQTPEFDAELDRLRIAVYEHAKREERYEFMQLRAAHPPERLVRMAGALRAAEKIAPTRPHPGVESATKNLLLGPPTALVDRVRDAVRDAMRD
ncbi:MAG TPA: hemerythrin domain-containing protein [Pilimelia sp.]|nr:hemerythrin domain-containing protein [Pilimelia sp.]